jgi:hypothetical protein
MTQNYVLLVSAISPEGTVFSYDKTICHVSPWYSVMTQLCAANQCPVSSRYSVMTKLQYGLLVSAISPPRYPDIEKLCAAGECHVSPMYSVMTQLCAASECHVSSQVFSYYKTMCC